MSRINVNWSDLIRSKDYDIYDAIAYEEYLEDLETRRHELAFRKWCREWSAELEAYRRQDEENRREAEEAAHRQAVMEKLASVAPPSAQNNFYKSKTQEEPKMIVRVGKLNAKGSEQGKNKKPVIVSAPAPHQPRIAPLVVKPSLEHFVSNQVVAYDLMDESDDLELEPEPEFEPELEGDQPAKLVKPVPVKASWPILLQPKSTKPKPRPLDPEVWALPTCPASKRKSQPIHVNITVAPTPPPPEPIVYRYNRLCKFADQCRKRATCPFAHSYEEWQVDACHAGQNCRNVIAARTRGVFVSKPNCQRVCCFLHPSETKQSVAARIAAQSQ